MAKYTIDFGQDVDAMLKQQSDKKAITKAEIIRRALSTYMYLEQETEKGRKVTIQDDATNTQRELILP